MTLCMAWRSNGSVHFASDSRLTVARNSYTDVGIKVSCPCSRPEANPSTPACRCAGTSELAGWLPGPISEILNRVSVRG